MDDLFIMPTFEYGFSPKFDDIYEIMLVDGV